ncbi:MAG TPA: CDP-alcohol phosphatidyltransferase family protein [bacterium]|nr:CDP-alcohol phosphatidyltransferase family protein [bacterium]HNT64840.1 CDP-alcohol phosphatidyltransferase family protein [bacterium]HOX84992.1 CDP-alcohol phosphatidyltransferase family protein [bacterium]HPG44142.1 CDP-alcohol phosphatidyltransferase family protein [bacterium]HPM96509.1 CDP-alcohol phosphatidyltransferase family protein [bacterium]
MRFSKEWFNPANMVTVGRIFLLFIVVLLIQNPNPVVRAICIAIIPAVFILDSVDGYLARHHCCTTRLGSVLDIAGDRIVESVLWIMLGFLHLIPIWIPIVVVARGILTDGFRTVAIAGGQTPFSVMKSRMGWWLVASPLSRTSYAILKAVVFTLGFLLWNYALPSESTIKIIFFLLVAITVAQCLIRSVYSIRDCLYQMAKS